MSIVSNLNILFVDDESFFINAFKVQFEALFKSQHITLNCFDKVSDCLAFLKENKLNKTLVFSDISMPEQDGFDLLNEIRANYPDLDLYFISSNNEDMTKLKASSLGAKGFLSKPINFSAVNSILNDYSS